MEQLTLWTYSVISKLICAHLQLQLTLVSPCNWHGLNMQGAGQSLLASSTHQSQEGTSPPEAAIEATPETTPIKVHKCFPFLTQPIDVI